MSLEVTKPPKIGDLVKINPSITKTDIEGYRTVETWSKGPSARNPWIPEYESWRKVNNAMIAYYRTIQTYD